MTDERQETEIVFCSNCHVEMEAKSNEIGSYQECPGCHYKRPKIPKLFDDRQLDLSLKKYLTRLTNKGASCPECQGNPSYFAQYDWDSGREGCRTCKESAQ